MQKTYTIILFILTILFSLSTGYLLGLSTTNKTSEPVSTHIVNLSKNDLHTTHKKANINSTSIHIAKGDTFVGLLHKMQIDNAEIYKIVYALKHNNVKPELISGKSMEISLNDQHHIRTIKLYPRSLHNTSIIRNTDGKFIIHQAVVKKKILHAVGTIESSIFNAALSSGLSNALTMQLTKLYSHTLDFQRDIKYGNKFEILFERFFNEDGKLLQDGNILFASITTDGNTHKIYRYKFDNGRIEYFDENGHSIEKSLLKTPINGARISSKFGMRKHPTLGYSRMHKGIDFAAPTGTAIYAAGNGTIEYMGRRGGYGNYIKIRHNSIYSTAYGHISKFNKHLKKNMRVKQGQVIAYVGSTGLSTGPHLHYEVIYYGKQINPKNVKAKATYVLTKQQLQKFKNMTIAINGMMQSTPSVAEFASIE